MSEKIQSVQYEGGMAVVTYAQLAVGGILAVVLLASGIGLLRAAPWARTSSLAYAVAAIIVNAASQVVAFVFVYPAIGEITQSQGGEAGTAAMSIAYGAGICGGIFSLALPITMLIVLTRPSVKAQFQ
jgi:hypothetical protein